MNAPLYHIRRTGGLTAICLLLLLLAGLSCPAQSERRLPDSIPGSMENTPETIVTADTANGGEDKDTAAQQDDTLPQQDSATFRAVPDTVITRWKKDRDFAYANDPAFWTREKKEKDSRFLRFLGELFSSRGFQYFIYLLLAGILVYALYRIIAENNLRLFYRKPVSSGGRPQELSLEEEDLDKGLEQALTRGDHRLATRYLYLKALRLLDVKELIRYHPQATNQEYIDQTRALPQGVSFRFLTGAYERVWYGELAINATQFDWLLRSFQDFYKSISAK